mmetsp:Transcript_120540/g.300703  ORF Transcript_120540/g.300703 Transcript_120540/m.300703 type:complete len:464 (-) Transcript_120540:177-1568(-)
MGKKPAAKKEEEPSQPAPAAEAGEAPQLSLEQAKHLARYDNTAKMTPFLDRHLIFPILNQVQESGIYKTEDVTRVELQLLAETWMIDYACDRYEGIGEEPPASLTDRREDILEKLASCRNHVMRLLEILEDDEKVKRISTFKSIGELCDAFDIEPEMVDELVTYAKMQFDCGNYELSSQLLKHYRNMPQASETMTPKQITALWGSAASALLLKEFQGDDSASELIFKLDEYLENAKAPKSEVLLHRTWLLHWTLFAIFWHDKPDPKLMDFLLNEKSLSIISLSCPHLFRYVGAVLILQKRLKHLVKDTVWIIHHEAATYSDPVTRFLLALYTEMDYDDAQHELQRCEQVCLSDCFLRDHWNEFQENARLHIFESYCRIHQCINIQMISSKLNMEAEEAELWIVKLIQNAKLDARIDSEKSRVVMTKAPPNVYQQVIEKTKNLAFRSTMLVSNMDKEKAEKASR